MRKEVLGQGPESFATDIPTRARLLHASLSAPLPPAPSLATFICRHSILGLQEEIHAINALVDRLQTSSTRVQPQELGSALRLLICLADMCDQLIVPICSTPTYPLSLLVLQRQLVKSRDVVPAPFKQVIAQQRGASPESARSEPSLRSGCFVLRPPPRAALLVAPIAKVLVADDVATCRRQPLSEGPTAALLVSVSASATVLPGDAGSLGPSHHHFHSRRCTHGVSQAVASLPLKMPASPPAVGLKPLPLVLPPLGVVHWPGYLTDTDTDEAGSARGIRGGSGGSSRIGDASLSCWWHEAHWGTAGARRIRLLSEEKAAGHALTALSGWPSLSYFASPPAPSHLTPPNLCHCMPCLSASTLTSVMRLTSQATSRAASLNALADNLTLCERHSNFSVAFAFGQALRGVLHRHQAQLSSLPDAIALRVVQDDEGEGEETKARSVMVASALPSDCVGADECRSRTSKCSDAHVRGTTLLGVLAHARQVFIEQQRLHDFCFRRLPSKCVPIEADGGVATATTSAAAGSPADAAHTSQAAAADGCTSVPSGFPTGVDLLNALYLELDPLDGIRRRSCAFVWHFFTAAATPWLRWMRHTLFRATASDTTSII